MNATVFLICLSAGSGAVVAVCARGVAGAFCADIPTLSEAKVNKAQATGGIFTIFALLDKRTAYFLHFAENRHYVTGCICLPHGEPTLVFALVSYRLQVNSYLFSFLIKMRALEAEGSRGVRDLVVIALEFGEDGQLFEGADAIRERRFVVE